MRYQVQPTMSGTFAVVDIFTGQVHGTFGSPDTASSIAASMNQASSPMQPGGMSYSPSIY